jgi:hypothetical protein
MPLRESESSAGPLRLLVRRCGSVGAGLGVYDPENRPEIRRRRASLILAHAFERYHQHEARASIGLAGIARPTDVLESYRSRIAHHQRAVNKRVKWSFGVLAGLFALAVLLFEIFEKFFHANIKLLGSYICVLCAIGVLAWYASWRRWSEIAEDYRAVAEMLRVQWAWWSAGLTARADREHLQGADQHLAPVRDCAKTVISWILLRAG